MKMNRIVFPLILALVATMAATGCKKSAPKTTPLLGAQGPGITDSKDNQTLQTAQPYDPNADVNRVNRGALQTANIDEFEGMIKDPAALAPYTIHFKFDSAVVMKDDHSKLQAIASALKSSPNDKLLIEGNCDERGTEEYNRALGERRALAARETLAKLGVSPDRIRTISYGKDKPVNLSHSDAAWSANRRADFVLLHPKPGSL